MNYSKTGLKIADEVFLATALLHREHPDRCDMPGSEIIQRIRTEFGDLRPGVPVHVSVHCVANVEPEGGRYRMLYKTSNGNRRLLLSGDDIHPNRHGKIFPAPEDIPEKYRDLVAWANQRYEAGGGRSESPLLDFLSRARGLGKELWRGVNADEYVRELREGWD
jgi:hypothetical protein